MSSDKDPQAELPEESSLPPAERADGEPGVAGGAESAPASREELEGELARTRSAYTRLAADFENFKRRRAQETQELARYGSAGMLQALLPALDNLARAVAHMGEAASDGVSEGIRLTLRQLEEALASQGVQRVPTVGHPFDPHLHDAVSTVPGENLERDMVVDELLPGYQIHDRVVRPAQVTVAQASRTPAAAKESSQELAQPEPGVDTSGDHQEAD